MSRPRIIFTDPKIMNMVQVAINVAYAFNAGVQNSGPDHFRQLLNQVMHFNLLDWQICANEILTASQNYVRVAESIDAMLDSTTSATEAEPREEDPK